MRKRIIIGVLAVVVTGVGVYLVAMLLGPKKGSLEWHKSEYLRVLDRAARRTWRDTLQRRVCARITSVIRVDTSEEERLAQFGNLKEHEIALIRLGFLQKREILHGGGDSIVVDGKTNYRGRRMEGQSHVSFSPNGLSSRRNTNMSPYARAYPAGTVTIAIGVASDIPKWEQVVREKDLALWEQMIRKADGQ